MSITCKLRSQDSVVSVSETNACVVLNSFISITMLRIQLSWAGMSIVGLSFADCQLSGATSCLFAIRMLVSQELGCCQIGNWGVAKSRTGVLANRIVGNLNNVSVV